MAYNKELIKENLSDISKDSFKEAIFLCYKDGITARAPLGFSGDSIMLFGNETPDRVSVVSIRNYSGDAELLITDKKGRFLFYGRFDVDMGLDFVADMYWKIFNKLKSKIETVMPSDSKFKVKDAENVSYSVGFDMLKSFQMAANERAVNS